MPFVIHQLANDIGRSDDPRIVRQAAFRIGSFVVVDQFACGWNSIVEIVGAKCEVLWILDEVEQVSVRATELLLAIHTERVIPDDPTAAMETDVLARQFQLGRVLVADRQPKGSVALQDSMNGRDPIAGPGEIVIPFQLVVVDIIFVADVEWRVRERQINVPFGQSIHSLDTIAADNRIERVIHSGGLLIPRISFAAGDMITSRSTRRKPVKTVIFRKPYN